MEVVGASGDVPEVIRKDSRDGVEQPDDSTPWVQEATEPHFRKGRTLAETTKVRTRVAKASGIADGVGGMSQEASVSVNNGRSGAKEKASREGHRWLS